MTTGSRPPAASYEVELAGRIGPAYRAALATSGTRRPGTTSYFLLPGSCGDDICDVIAMLQARGLVVLDVRRVQRRSPQVTRELAGEALGSSAVGDAAARPARDCSEHEPA